MEHAGRAFELCFMRRLLKAKTSKRGKLTHSRSKRKVSLRLVQAIKSKNKKRGICRKYTECQSARLDSAASVFSVGGEP